MSNQQTGSLVVVDLTSIGAVVGFTDNEGRVRLSSWTGKTKKVWAQFKDGELPPLTEMRDNMVAAYEPMDTPIPQGLIACICYETAIGTPWIPRKKEVVVNVVCAGCSEFKAYREAEARNERNCLRWLCAGGSNCPNKDVILGNAARN